MSHDPAACQCQNCARDRVEAKRRCVLALERLKRELERAAKQSTHLSISKEDAASIVTARRFK